MDYLSELPDELLVVIMYMYLADFKSIVALSGTCKRLRNIARGNIIEQIRFMVLGCPVLKTPVDVVPFVLRWHLYQVYPLLYRRSLRPERIHKLLPYMVHFGPWKNESANDPVYHQENYSSHVRFLQKQMHWNNHANKIITYIESNPSALQRFKKSPRDIYVSLVKRIKGTDVPVMRAHGFPLVCPVFAAIHGPSFYSPVVMSHLRWWPEVIERNRAQLMEAGCDVPATFVEKHQLQPMGNDIEPWSFKAYRYEVFDKCHWLETEEERTECLNNGNCSFWKQITNIDFLNLIWHEMMYHELQPPFQVRECERTVSQVVKDAKATMAAGEPYDFDTFMQYRHRFRYQDFMWFVNQ